MAVIRRVIRHGRDMYSWYCPACNINAYFDLKSWKWNLDYYYPSIGPGLLHATSDGGICHSIITRGIIHYLPDSTHSMSGQNANMITMEE